MHQEGTLHQKWTSLVGPDWLRPFSERQHFASDLLMGPWWWFVSSWDPLWERNWTRLHQTETPGKLSPSLSPEGKTISENRGCFLDRRLKVNAGSSVNAFGNQLVCLQFFCRGGFLLLQQKQESQQGTQTNSSVKVHWYSHTFWDSLVSEITCHETWSSLTSFCWVSGSPHANHPFLFHF